MTDPGPAGDGGDQQHDADGGGLPHRTGTDEAHVDAHQQGDRDGHGDGEDTPRAVRQGTDDDDGQHGDQDDHDAGDAEDGEPAPHGTQFVLGHLTQGRPRRRMDRRSSM